MSFQQLVTPNPNIPCQPGWCLQYVRQAFGAPVVEPTATAGWNNAKFKHRDWNFPDGVWVPLWFSLETEPAGHVVLRAPNGNIYSTTNPNQYTPRRHPNIADLFAAYAPYNPLTYLGWSEDISGVRVVQESAISVQSVTITPAATQSPQAAQPEEEDDMPSAAEIAKEIMNYNVNRQGPGQSGQTNLAAALAWADANNATVIRATADTVLNTPIRRQGKGAGLGDNTSLGAMVAWHDSGTLDVIAAVAASAASDGKSVEDIKAAVTDALREGTVKVDVTVQGAQNNG